jgi:hypothetical protein
MKNYEFSVTEYSLPRHWGVDAAEVDEEGFLIEYTTVEFARFSTRAEAFDYLKSAQQFLLENKRLPEERVRRM